MLIGHCATLYSIDNTAVHNLPGADTPLSSNTSSVCANTPAAIGG